ncbi:MAG: metalloregulator ArsR/SmtB family transcription factor [Acidocella sp.]|nr:metalloregulator ArsR/SmtB family transcription factor [Acidocella sp.]
MTPIYQSRDSAVTAAEKLKIYAQPQRLMILSHLLESEHTVGEIDAATNIGQPALSQQLAALRNAGLVQTRRVAKQVYYRLADDKVAACVLNIESMFTDTRSAPAPQPHITAVGTTISAPQYGAANFAKLR